jgi:hypothetical protein
VTERARRLAPLLGRLTGLATRSRKARELRMELEHLLMRITDAGGLRAAERAVTALNARDRHLVLIEKRASLRAWREELAGGRRTLEIQLVVNRLFRSALVRYQFVRKLRLTPRQRRIHAVQEAFYARYMEVGQKAYRDPRYRLAPDERLVLLVGELEADVNNGGFSQYLDNKGRRRARAALAALRKVGARKTARLLETAMAPHTTATQRSALDDRFSVVPEDLALLAARRVGLRPSPPLLFRPPSAGVASGRRARTIGRPEPA